MLCLSFVHAETWCPSQQFPANGTRDGSAYENLMPDNLRWG